MRIYCRVTDNGLVPMYDSDLEEKRRLKIGTDVLCDIKKPRNYKFHKKFFALIRLTFDNLPHNIQDILGIYSEADMLLSLKIDLGISSIVSISGRDVYREGSISFAAMDEAEFEGFYNRCVNMILHRYLAGTNRSDLLEEVERYL